MKRTKKVTKSERKFLIIIYVLGAIGVILFTYFFVNDIVRKHSLQNNGVRVQGVVDTKDIQYIHAKTTTFTRRTIDYHFQTIGTDELVVRADVPVTNGEYEKLSEGKSIELRYDANNPKLNFPVSALKHVSPTYSFVFVLAGIVAGLSAYSFIYKKYGKRYLETKSKSRWIGFLQFLAQMCLIFVALFTGGSIAGIFVQGLNLLLFGAS